MSGGGPVGEGGDDDIGSLDLNLTALMDILSNLLFFLLASFGAAVISVVSASVPVSSTGDSDVAKSDDSITMTVNLGPAGFRIVPGSETIDPAVLETLKLNIPRLKSPPKDAAKGALNELDYPKLTEALYRVKQSYPKSESVILVPDPKIKYDEVVQTMDASRERWETDAKGKLLKKHVLFGKVVVSTTIQ